MTNKKIIFLAIFLVLLLFGFIFSKKRLPKISPPTEKIIPTTTSFPTWVPRPSAKRPTITYEKFPFKASDKTRKVEIVGCVIDNSEWGMSYPKKTVEVPNVSKILTETMKAFLAQAAQTGWGGFPTKQEIKNYFGYEGEVTLKNLTLDKKGVARVYFSKEVKAYGGGSGRVACMQDSVELTLKQFPSIKDVVLCIENTCADQKGSEIFRP
jgi:hypothetical protein